MGDSPTFYILSAKGIPSPARDAVSWHIWVTHCLESEGRRIGLDSVGDVVITTVFTGVSVGHDPGGRPLLWETLVTNSKGGGEAFREHYGTAEAARRGHADTVKRHRGTIARGIRLRS